MCIIYLFINIVKILPACAILGKTQRQSQITAIQRTQIVLIWIDSMILAVIFQPKWFSDSVLQFHMAMASSPDEGFAWSPGWLGVLLAHRPFQPWGHGIGIFWEGNVPSHLGRTLLAWSAWFDLHSQPGGQCQPWLWLVWGYRCGDTQQVAPHMVSSVLLCIICTQPSAASKLVKLQFLRPLSSLARSCHA